MAANNQGDSFTSGLDFGIQESTEMSSAQIFDLMESDEKVDPSKLEKAGKPEKKKKVVQKIEEDEDEDEDLTSQEEGEVENLLDKMEKEEEPVKKKVVQEKEPEESEEEEGEGEEESHNPFNSISKQLFELGIFTFDDSDDEVEITNGEDLRDRFEYEKKKGVTQVLENFLARKGQEYKDMFDAVFINGVSPREYLQAYADVEDFRNANLESEHVQKKVIAEAMRLQGFDEEDIEDEVAKAEQYGDLEDKAKKYHKMLVKKQEEKLKDIETKEQAKTQEEVRKDAYYRESLTKILTKKIQEKEFDSIPVTQEMAQSTMDFLYTKKWKTPAGKLITDFDKEILELDQPENYEYKVKVGLLLNLLKKDPELKSLQRKAITKESNNVFSELAEKTIKKQNTTPKKPTSWFNK